MIWHDAHVTSLQCHSNYPLWGNRRINSTHKGPVMLNLHVVFDVSLTKLLNKQSNWRWFETPWRSNNITVMGNLTLVGVMRYILAPKRLKCIWKNHAGVNWSTHLNHQCRIKSSVSYLGEDRLWLSCLIWYGHDHIIRYWLILQLHAVLLK